MCKQHKDFPLNSRSLYKFERHRNSRSVRNKSLVITNEFIRVQWCEHVVEFADLVQQGRVVAHVGGTCTRRLVSVHIHATHDQTHRQYVYGNHFFYKHVLYILIHIKNYTSIGTTYIFF